MKQDRIDMYNTSKRIEILKRKLEIEKLRLETLFIEDQLKDLDGDEYLKSQLEAIIKSKRIEVLEKINNREHEINEIKKVTKLPKISYQMIHQFLGTVYYDIQIRDTSYIKWLKDKGDSPEIKQRIQKEYDKIIQVIESELDKMLLADDPLFDNYKLT